MIGIDGNTLHIEEVDVVDGAPLLDIKPYIARYDVRQTEREGWLSATSADVLKMRSDGRFC